MKERSDPTSRGACGANVVQFPPRHAGAVVIDMRAHTLRDSRRLISDCRAIRAESRALERSYRERQERIELLLRIMERA